MSKQNDIVVLLSKTIQPDYEFQFYDVSVSRKSRRCNCLIEYAHVFPLIISIIRVQTH